MLHAQSTCCRAALSRASRAESLGLLRLLLLVAADGATRGRKPCSRIAKNSSHPRAHLTRGVRVDAARTEEPSRLTPDPRGRASSAERRRPSSTTRNYVSRRRRKTNEATRNTRLMLRDARSRYHEITDRYFRRVVQTSGTLCPLCPRNRE